MLKSAFYGPSPQVTTDCIDEDLSKPRVDGGKWCGQIVRGLKRQKAIRIVGYQPSCRPDRHGGPVAICVIDDIRAAVNCLEELEAYIADNPVRPADTNDRDVEFATMTFVCCFSNFPNPVLPPDAESKTGVAV